MQQAGAGTSGSTPELFGRTSSRPLVIAHRGASRAAPENTLDAFRAAIDIGCDAVELDVRRTADMRLVVHHAASRRGRRLEQLGYEDLQRRSRHRPPSFDEVVALCAGRIGLDVELKETNCEEDVLAALARRRFPAERLIVTSFHASVVARMKGLAPHIPCGLLVSPAGLRATRRGIPPPELRARECGADLLLPHHLLVPLGRRRLARRPDLLEAAAAAALPVIVWTVNSPRRMRRYADDPRVAGVITDVPDVALGAVQGLSRHSPAHVF